MPVFTIETPNGRQLDIEADDHAAALQGAEQWYKQNVTDKTDTSLTGALTQGASDLVSGVGKTLKEYGAPETGKTVQEGGAAISNPKYKSASDQFSHPEDGAEKHVLGRDWSKLPRAMVEQAPGMAADLGAAYMAKRFGPLWQAAAAAASYGLRSAGNEAQKRATGRTGDASAEPTTEDKVIGLGSTGAQAALNQIGISKILNPAKVAGVGASGVAQAAKNVATAAAAEGATNAAQDVVSQAASTAGTKDGLRVDPNSVLDSGIFGAAGGAAFSAPKGGKDALTATRFRDFDPGVDTARAANRIQDKVEKPSDLANPKKAFEAVSAAMADTRNEFAEASKGITNPTPETANAIARGRAGEALTPKELAAIDSEGNDTLSSLARQTTALRKLTGKGTFDGKDQRFAGGVSETVRKLALNNPLAAAGANAAPHILAQGSIGADALLASVPGMAQTAAGGVAAYQTLKQIEKTLGIHSPAKTFAEKFADPNAGLREPINLNQSPTGPKVTAQNSLTPAQPWGPIEPKPERFKPDIIEPGLRRIVDKIEKAKRSETVREAAPLLKQLAAQNKPEPEGPSFNPQAMHEQVRGALLKAAVLRKMQGAQPERVAPEPQPKPEAPRVEPQVEAESFTLPESPYWHMEPSEASHAILKDAMEGPKDVRHPERYRASTERRLQGEQDAYLAISNELSKEERPAFHKYLSALWGSDSPEVVHQVRDHMLAAFPRASDAIKKHLSDIKIEALWKKPKGKK